MTSRVVALVVWAAVLGSLAATGIAYGRAVSSAGAPASPSNAALPRLSTQPHAPVRVAGDAPGLSNGLLARAVRPSARQERQPLTVTVVLKRTDQAGFDRYLREVYSPRSRLYDHFLSQTQLANRFGPSRSVYAMVRAWLVSEGFTVRQTSANRLSLTVRGTRAQAERAFATPIRNLSAGGARAVYANVTAPAVPRALASHVQAVIGLSNRAEPTPHHESVPDALNDCWHFYQLIPPGTGGGLITVANYIRLVFALAIADLAFIAAGALYAYCSGLYLGAAWFGPGGLSGGAGSHGAIAHIGHSSAGPPQKLGLLEYDTYHASDVANWLTLVSGDPAGVPTVVSRLSQTPVNGGVASPGSGESEVLLDIDSVLAGASQPTKVVAYEAPLSTSFVQMFQTMVGDGDTVISNSWYQCEDQVPSAEAQAIDSVLASASASGITVLNATGDYGSGCGDGSANTIGVPADSPHATAVGGTTPKFGSGLTYGSETWWNAQAATPAGGAGGFGVSRYFAVPSYQAGLTSATMRSVPDLSFDADPTTGMELCQADAGGCPAGSESGGTSMAAPLVAAEVANLDNALGRSVGDLGAALYPLAGTNAFHTPQSMGSDFAHVGLGSPNFTAVYQHLTGTSTGAVSASNSPAGGFGAPQADGSQQGIVRVNLRDAKGFPVGGKTVTLTPDAGSSAVVSPAAAATDPTTGSAVFTVKDTNPETVGFTAADTSDSVTLTTRPTLRFTTPVATGASISGGPASVPNDGSSHATIYVYLQNALGRPASGKTVTLTAASGSSVIKPAGAASASNTSTTDANGTATFTATDTAVEGVDLSATDVTDGNLPVPGALVVSFGPSSATCKTATSTPVSGFSASAWVSGLAFTTQSAVLPGNFTEPACSAQSPPVFDASGNGFVPDPLNGTIHEFGPAGGVASALNALPNAAFNGSGLGNLAFGKDGSLYAGLITVGGSVSNPEIVQVDPVTGSILRVVANAAAGLTDCPFALAVDPLSGDLFTADECSGFAASNQITRIESPSSAHPTVAAYTNDSGVNIGLTFAPDGTLYAAEAGGCRIDRIGGTNTSSPSPTPVATVPCGASGVPAGVTVAATDSAGHATALDVFAFGGDVSRIDLTTSPATVSTVGSGASYFYIGATTAGGCDFAPLPGTIEKFGSGQCGASTATGPQIQLTSAGPSPAPTGTSVTYTAQLSNFSAAPGTPVYFEVTGANAQVKLVAAGTDGSATFTLPGALTGEDTIAAAALNGTTQVTSAPMKQRWTAGKDVSFLSLNQSPESGLPGQAAHVAANLVDLSQSPPAPITGASVTLSLAGGSCTATTDGSGNASCAITPTGALGMDAITASYAGDTTHTPSTASNSFAFGGVGIASGPFTNPPSNTVKPTISGTPLPDHGLTCSTGTWTGSPTGYAYRWNRAGTAITGATHQTYTVQIADEAQPLTCTVTATNAAGAASATSAPDLVAVPGTLSCPKPSGKLSGTHLGPVALGMTRKAAIKKLHRYTKLGFGFDNFCLYAGFGIRVAFPSAKLLRTIPAHERRRQTARIVIALTANPFYRLDGVTPGTSLSRALTRRLKLGRTFHIGLNFWYISPGRAADGILKVRGGIIQEIGLATKALTGSRKAQGRFLQSFKTG